MLYGIQQLRNLFLNKPVPQDLQVLKKEIPKRADLKPRQTNPIPDLEKIAGWWKGRYEINHSESIRAMNTGDRERARIFADRARTAEIFMEGAYRKVKKEVKS